LSVGFGLNLVKYLRISATTSCNANCWYCFNERQPFDYSELNDLKGFKWFINLLLNEYGTEIVRFTGGEPLTNSRIFDLIHIAKESGVKKVGLTTNGILIQKYMDQLETSGVDQYAVHLYQIDEPNPANIKRIKDFIKNIVSKLNQVRFNIVLTMKNKEYVKELIKYAQSNNINLLILDMVKAGITTSDFESTYCSLDEIRETLSAHEFTEKVENLNSKIYESSTSYVKLVEHYADYKSRSSYCTRNLEYNPLLLNPNFELSVCTHFGKQSFSIANAVKKQDVGELHEIILHAKKYLASCEECSQKVFLTT